MDWAEFKHMGALARDIAYRQKRIDRLQDQLADGPMDVSDTVQSSQDAGNATIICHAVVHGQDVEYRRKEMRMRILIADLEQKNKMYRDLEREAAQIIDSVNDPLLRDAMHLFCFDGCSYEDIADQLGSTGEAWRKQIQRFFRKTLKKA